MLYDTNFISRNYSLIKDSVLDFLIPRFCLVCQQNIPKNFHKQFICQHCLDALPFSEANTILYNQLLSSIDSEKLAFNQLFSLFSVEEHRQYMNLIYALKYQHLQTVGLELGDILASKMQLEGLGTFDGIIPVPIHPARKRERGYNQSFFIALGMSAKFELPVIEDIIQRKIYTPSQTQLNARDRSINVKDIFTINNTYQRVTSKSYILVDDVLTTGSTVNSCSTALLDHGARNIVVACLVKK